MIFWGFWGILEPFLYKNKCILDMFFAQNAPEILKISACGGHFLTQDFKNAVFLKTSDKNTSPRKFLYSIEWGCSYPIFSQGG